MAAVTNCSREYIFNSYTDGEATEPARAIIALAYLIDAKTNLEMSYEPISSVGDMLRRGDFSGASRERIKHIEVSQIDKLMKQLAAFLNRHDQGEK